MPIERDGSHIRRMSERAREWESEWKNEFRSLASVAVSISNWSTLPSLALWMRAQRQKIRRDWDWAWEWVWESEMELKQLHKYYMHVIRIWFTNLITLYWRIAYRTLKQLCRSIDTHWDRERKIVNRIWLLLPSSIKHTWTIWIIHNNQKKYRTVWLILQQPTSNLMEHFFSLKFSLSIDNDAIDDEVSWCELTLNLKTLIITFSCQSIEHDTNEGKQIMRTTLID